MIYFEVLLAFIFIFETENVAKLPFHNTDQINHPISFLFKEPIPSWILYATLALLVSSCLQLYLSNGRRIKYFGSESSLAVTAKQSVTFFLELNHETLTSWCQIDQCHFAYTAESLVRYLKLCGLLTQTSVFSTSCQL